MADKKLPSMDDVISYLNAQTREVSKRELAQRFKIKGEGRVYLKHLLKEIEARGMVHRLGRHFVTQNIVKERQNVEITGVNRGGDLVGRILHWDGEGESPQVLIIKDNLKPPCGVGDIILTKVKMIHKNLYEGEALKRVSVGQNKMVGVFFDGKIVSVDRRFKEAFRIDDSFPQDMKSGDVFLVEIPLLKDHNSAAHFIEKVGKETDPHVASLIAIFTHRLPMSFSEKTLKEAQKVSVPPLDKRTDLRELPFVTVDGADARDFDDAVFVESFEQGGWHIYVAIADVAWFVRPNNSLDRDAFLRGNSTYFPDRVLPMLPQALSNGVCSLNPNEDRPAMVCEVWLDKDGHKIKHQFLRALIRSKARLTYEEVQAHFEHREEIKGLEDLMASLLGAFKVLKEARIRRGVLDLDVPEMQVVLNPKGQVIDIHPRQRFEAHQMIEELMILANVSAAQTLEKLSLPTMYRVHDRPSVEKMESLRTFLKSMGLVASFKEKMTPQDFNDILDMAKQGKTAQVINEMVLRTQSQAQYSPENIGHYGLALDKYAHFTSPIRRYADLLVHRALIKGLRLGEGGLTEDEATGFDKIAEHISATERQSAAAEQDAVDRYVASYLAHRVGEEFVGRISSVRRFGLFVTLDEFGADGLVPLSSMKKDYYIFDERREVLQGRMGKTLSRGQMVSVILREAVPLTGGLLFQLVENGKNDSRQKLNRKKTVRSKRR